MSFDAGLVFSFVCVFCILLSYAVTRDVFSPAVLGGLLFAISVGGSAISLISFDLTQLYLFDFDAHTLYYAVGIFAFTIGAISVPPHSAKFQGLSKLTHLEVRSLFKAAMTLGAISWLIYLLQLRAGGGFVEVYSNIKGRGSLGTGIQDLLYLGVPATALLMVVFNRSEHKVSSGFAILFCILPLLLTGVLSSRRGPSIQALSTIFFAYYLTRHTRPSFLILLVALVAGATLALFLVAFRGEIYLGSDLLSRITLEEVANRIADFAARPMEGHEFIYSSYVMAHSSDQGDFWWGARYLAALTIWWIPSFTFPGKYEAFGLEGMLVNGGTNGTNTIESIYTPGAAPMLLADLFVEFWYFGLLFVFLLGRYLATLWRSASSNAPLAVTMYICALSVLIYLFAQNFTAFAQRYAIMVVPAIIVLRMYGVKETSARREMGGARVRWSVARDAPPRNVQ